MSPCFLVEGKLSVKLEDVLIFFSGSCAIPPTGFQASPSIDFLHNEKFCTASTCDLTLRLPVYIDYGDFQEAVTLSLLGHDGFGGGV